MSALAKTVEREPVAVPRARLRIASARACAWCRVLDAVADMRDALDHRVYLESPSDTFLEADVRAFTELAMRCPII